MNVTFAVYVFTVYSNDQKPAGEPEGSIELLRIESL